jgi:TolB-like protein
MCTEIADLAVFLRQTFNRLSDTLKPTSSQFSIRWFMVQRRYPLLLSLLVFTGIACRAEGTIADKAIPTGVMLVPAKPVAGCLDSLQANENVERLVKVLSGSGFLRPDSGGSVVLRVVVDTADGLCQIKGVLQDDQMHLESRRFAPRGDSVQVGHRMEQVVNELASQWGARKFARLEIVSKPEGMAVTLDGQSVGKTPLALERLLPGLVRIRLDAAGWDTSFDTARLEAGSLLQREISMRRSQAWLDSVHRADVARRRDSLWGVAHRSPAQALPDLFARLGRVAVPGASRQSIAVMPFQVTGSTKPGYDPGVMAAEYGVAHFAKDPRFVVVERDGLNRLLKEQALSLSGATDSGGVEAGKLLSAQYLVMGTVEVSGNRQVFAARLVSVETGEVVSAAVATLGSDHLEELYRTALGERGQLSGSLYRSAVGPGWGQFYTGHPVQGALALGASALALGFVGWSWFDYAVKDDDLQKYRNHDPSTSVAGEKAADWIARAESVRKVRNDAGTRLGISWGVLGGVWLANLLDAGILGYGESRRIKAEYFAGIPMLTVQSDGVQLSWRF